ncbi:MAG: lipid-A-disaccharide synthase [Gammaproteobacteria bacterium]|nr:lipid-A-disaccharide synthase [Gammaproteobacteria bacterium]
MGTEVAKKIMFVAGEASGDKHAAKLIAQLHDSERIACYGMGMQKMKQAGMQLLVDAQPLAVIGIVEILIHYPALRRAFRTLKQSLINEPPDLLVLVDYPEFNLKLARIAAQRNIKILYYISPQLWAWRQYRIKKIKHYIDHIAVIFPFEQDFYEQHKVAVSYVGHPLIEDLKAWESNNPEPAAERGETKTVLLLPGSRKSEIKRLLPLMIQTAKIIRQRLGNDIRFRLLAAADINTDFYRQYLDDADFDCRLNDKHTYTEMKNADLAISATGTATLQLALCGTPLIATHKLAPLSYWILKWFIKIRYASMPNIIADQALVPEYLQYDATPLKLSEHACKLLNNPDMRKTMSQNLLALRHSFGTASASKTTAELIHDLIK